MPDYLDELDPANLVNVVRQLRNEVEELKRRTINVDSLSEIAPDLGQIIAGDFIALSQGLDATDMDACGVYLSASGKMFLGKPWNLGGVKNGVLMFGLKAEDGSAYFAGGQGTIDVTGMHMNGLGYFLDWNAVNGDYTRIGYIQMKLHGTNPAPALTIGQDNPENITLNPNPHFSSDAANWYGVNSIEGTKSYAEAFGNLALNTTGDGYCLAVDVDGNLIIGGSFTTLETVSLTRIAKYTIGGKRGTSGGYWYTPPKVHHPAVLLEAGHYATVATWHDPVLLPSPPYEPGLYNPGYYTYSQTWVPDRYSTAYDSQPPDVWIATGSWSAFSTGLNGNCNGIAVAPNGDIYAVGAFTTAGGTTVNGVAKWNGSAWSALGTTGLKKGGAAATGYAIAIDADGNVYVGGDFDQAGAVACANIAKWDGAAWNALGSGVNNIVRGLYACPTTKNILITGDFTQVNGAAHSYFAKWRPATSDYLTYANPSESGKCITGDINEYPIIGNSKVSRYNGASWDVTGTSDGTIYAVVLDWMGNIYAGGTFTTIGGVTVANLAYYDSYSGVNAWYKTGSVDNTVRGLAIHNKNLFIAKLDSSGTDKGILNARVMDIRMTPKLTLSTSNVVSRTFSGYYKKPVDGWNTRFILNWYDSGGSFLEEQLLFSAVDACDWIYFSYDIIPPENAVYVEFVVDMAMGTDQADTNYTLDILEHQTEIDGIIFSEKISEEYQIYFQPYPMIKRGSERGIIPSMSAFNVYAPLLPPVATPLAVAGNIDDGLHSWKVTNVDDYGETTLSAKSNVINFATGSDSYSKVLLHMDGANLSTTFTDESGKTWTPSGHAKLVTAVKQLGTASGVFDGTDDYISTPNHADLDLGTGDWTIDFWVRRNGQQTDTIGLLNATSGSTGYGVVMRSTHKISLYSNMTGTWAQNIMGGTTISDLTWTHVAVVRYGNTITLYVAGNSDGTFDCTGRTVSSGGAGAFIGWNNNAGGVSRYLNGWMDEVRLSKGIARWIANFTPPTAPYTSMLKQASVGLVAGPWATKKRRIYRTKAGDIGDYYFVDEVADNTTLTYTDNKADSELITLAPVTNTTASRPLFPRQVFKLWIEGKFNSAQTQTIDTAESLATYWKQTACANGDIAEFDIYLEEGIYTLDVIGLTNTTCGILDWYLDGISIGTAQDWYSAAATRNVVKTIASVSVVGSGYHVLKAVVNGHNASAGTPYYNWMITSFNMYQASR